MDLTIGVVPQGSIYDEVLFEMLDHHGVAYRSVDREGEPRKYPIVLISRYSEEAYTLALRSCNSESDVLIAEKIAAFDLVLSLLGGGAIDRRDNFDLDGNEMG